jgi:hypothetical protein
MRRQPCRTCRGLRDPAEHKQPRQQELCFPSLTMSLSIFSWHGFSRKTCRSLWLEPLSPTRKTIGTQLGPLRRSGRPLLRCEQQTPKAKPRTLCEWQQRMSYKAQAHQWRGQSVRKKGGHSDFEEGGAWLDACLLLSRPCQQRWRWRMSGPSFWLLRFVAND